MTGRSEASLSATVEMGVALARQHAVRDCAVSAPLLADLLTAQRRDEERHAADGYYIVGRAWLPLPVAHRLVVRLRHGLRVELGGTITSVYLYRPDVTWRRASGSTDLDAPRRRAARADDVGQAPSVPLARTDDPAPSAPQTTTTSAPRRSVGRPRVSGAA